MRRDTALAVGLALGTVLVPPRLEAGAALTRTDRQVNFNWGSAAPGNGVPADRFCVRWTGGLVPPRDGSYTFYTVSDDGIRLWVDGRLLIDNWTDHGETENRGEIRLQGGGIHAVRLEYFENAGEAVARLLWSGPGLEKQPVPSKSLFPDGRKTGETGTGLKAAYYPGQQLEEIADQQLPPGTKQAWARMAGLGAGWVVWESNRTGNWRIWHRKLDGSDLRQVTPDENNRDHFAPHLSPDGARFVFLSYPKGTDGYQEVDPKTVAPMYVINVDGSGLRQVAPNARCYMEDRAAVWLNNGELIYLAAGRGPTRLNLRTGERKPLPPRGLWLINATGTCASTGTPTFSTYNTAAGKLVEQPALGGCQPYFSTDGVWGFWMGGGGGPINRIRLATRKVSPIVTPDDPRLPAGRNYVYFPMLSHNQRLFAFGASPDAHDHFTADYDIYVAPCDPARLELTDTPVRYTFTSSCDRFPDVFLAAADPGAHAGNAPVAVSRAGGRSSDDPTWPVNHKGLVFAWQTADTAIHLAGSGSGPGELCKVKRQRGARLDHDSALVLDGGFALAVDADKRLLDACKASSELTIEATLTPRNVTQGGPARIVTFSSDPGTRDFTLGQEKDRLILRLRTPRTGVNGVSPELALCPVRAGQTCHVVVTYANGRVACHVDGKPVMQSRAVQGDFSNWSAQHLLFGDEFQGGRDWAGTLEGIAIFARALAPSEVERDYAASRRIRAARPRVETAVIQAELLARSEVPTLKQVLPYREALLVSEYRVNRVTTGTLNPKTVRVAQWALLDGAAVGAAARKPGWKGRLTLERFDQNSQLESLFMSDTLKEDFDAVLYFDPAL